MPLRALFLRLAACLALAASALADAGLRGRSLGGKKAGTDGLSSGTYVAIGLTSCLVVIPCCVGLYSYGKYKVEKYRFKHDKNYEIEEFSDVVVGDQFKKKGQIIFD